MIISFSGTPGSGKSGIARRLAKELGWSYYDMGRLRRTMAKEQGMTLEEFNRLGEKDPTTDTKVDDYQKLLGETSDNFVIVGRTSWHFIPHSIKIFFKVDPRVGAERIFKNLAGRNEASDLDTVEKVIESNRRRQESDRLRYQKYFAIDPNDESHYDFTLDTSNLSETEVFEKVSAYIHERLVSAQ